MDGEDESAADQIPSSTVREGVGRRVKELRQHAGLTQKELSEAAGIGNQMMSYIETGRAGTTLPRLEVIARALGCALSDIFDFDQLPPNDKAKRRSLRKLHTLVRDQDPAIIDLVTAQTRVLLRHLSKRG